MQRKFNQMKFMVTIVKIFCVPYVFVVVLSLVGKLILYSIWKIICL